MPYLLHTQERTLIPIEQEAGWTPAMIWTVLVKIISLTPAGIQTPDQSVASHYTDFAIPAPYSSVVFL